MKSKQTVILTMITTFAGIIYCSWPLGYILNPAASIGLASDLGAKNQPYNWVFIGGDVVTGIIMLAVVAYYLRIFQKPKPWVKLSLISMIIFSVGTALDALLPLNCVQTATHNCPSFTVDHLLLIHGICSVTASIYLLVAMFVIWKQSKRERWLLFIMIGYVVFFINSVINAFQDSTSNFSQHYYIALCSLCLAVFPYALQKQITTQSVVKKVHAAKLVR